MYRTVPDAHMENSDTIVTSVVKLGSNFSSKSNAFTTTSPGTVTIVTHLSVNMESKRICVRVVDDTIVHMEDAQISVLNVARFARMEPRKNHANFAIIPVANMIYVKIVALLAAEGLVNTANSILNADGKRLCQYCNPYSKKVGVFNENRDEVQIAQEIAKRLDFNKYQVHPVYTYSPYRECNDANRPDILIDAPEFKVRVLLECDEHGHSRKEYTPSVVAV